MCGRFARYAPHSRIMRALRIDYDDCGELSPDYNVPPGTQQPVAVSCDHGRHLLPLLWGFRPWWADASQPAPINARAETVASSPYFRSAFAHRRCLIPASGWFEWQKAEQGKVPHFIASRDDDLLCFAGVYEPATEERAASFAIITQPSKAHLQPLHDRMPLVLAPECWDEWLDPEISDRKSVKAATRGLNMAQLVAHPVSSRVNTPKNNGPDLIRSL
ncbi:SOS response-associated peptidase [Halorhodospira halophila]|uniref:Abasic site processing protein n=1 Tax=Halorhodospira halophila (strain DSM 244 / SL1) TaxID=349124 RepID=A1WWL2_HALHL|nr:SOS response-associated peptidase [Halorhodospira halophila]ABM62074.1 protein of unknown function DUF159 [Halorhodospira halophila SL1]MBK1729401.1 SOS response-associated peptidase [Halorhodospira halophila]